MDKINKVATTTTTIPEDDGFGPYQEGEDIIADTFDTPEEFEAAM